MASSPAPILHLGADSFVEIGVGANRAVRANATRIHPDWDLTTHTFSNPRALRADAGPNYGPFRRNERFEDATYNVTPLKLDGNYRFMSQLRNGTPVCVWISPEGKETGEPYVTFEGVATCSETVDAGFKRYNLTVVLNQQTTAGVN